MTQLLAALSTAPVTLQQAGLDQASGDFGDMDALEILLEYAPLTYPPYMLAGIGLVSAIAQIMMTDAYRKGEASLLAPFEYSAIIWTTALGALIWAEMPDAWDFLGILILVGAGLYIWHREMKLGVKR